MRLQQGRGEAVAGMGRGGRWHRGMGAAPGPSRRASDGPLPDSLQWALAGASDGTPQGAVRLPGPARPPWGQSSQQQAGARSPTCAVVLLRHARVVSLLAIHGHCGAEGMGTRQPSEHSRSHAQPTAAGPAHTRQRAPLPCCLPRRRNSGHKRRRLCPLGSAPPPPAGPAGFLSAGFLSERVCASENGAAGLRVHPPPPPTVGVAEGWRHTQPPAGSAAHSQHTLTGDCAAQPPDGREHADQRLCSRPEATAPRAQLQRWPGGAGAGWAGVRGGPGGRPSQPSPLPRPVFWPGHLAPVCLAAGRPRLQHWRCQQKQRRRQQRGCACAHTTGGGCCWHTAAAAEARGGSRRVTHTHLEEEQEEGGEHAHSSEGIRVVAHVDAAGGMPRGQEGRGLVPLAAHMPHGMRCSGAMVWP